MEDRRLERRRLRLPESVRRLLAASLLPLLLCGGFPLEGQPSQPVDGRTIESIEFKGLKAVSEDTLLYYLGLATGETLNQTALNRSIKQLWERNLIDGIEVDAEPTATGVKLTLTVTERPVLRSIDYQGLKRISKTDLQDKLTTQRIRLREGEPLSLGELQRVKALIEEMYSEKGYRFALAQYKVEDLENNEKKVVFKVDEGNQVRIHEIRFEGNTVFPDIRLRTAMKKTKVTAFVTRLTKKDIYDPAKLQEDLDKVRDLYRGAGYKNAVVGAPKIEVRTLDTGYVNKDEQRQMFITVPLEEGERWRFGTVKLEGNNVYAEKTLMRAFEYRPGSWLRQKVVDDGVKEIGDLYHNTGYIYARVEPELVERADRVADLVIHITEGEQFKVGRIEFQGNDRTMDKVLRRELRLWEEGLVNIGAIRNSVLKVNQLGYFKLNEEDPVDIQTDSDNKKVNLVFKGAESDRTELQFGGGWSEFDGFFGQFSINTKNFLGRGEQVGVSVQTGKVRNYFDLSYYIPWFRDKPQSIGIRAFNQNYDYSLLSSQQQFERSSKGAILTYGRNFRLFQSASISYNRSNYKDRTQSVVPTPLPGEPVPGPDQPQPGDLISVTTLINNSSLRPAWNYDSRDNPFEPTRGMKMQVAAEYAGGFLGGDNYFVRPEVTFSLFKPFATYPTRTVIAMNAEAGLISPFKGREIPIFERYYLGGENSVRGHRFRSMFLRLPNGEPDLDPTGVPLGGDKFAQLNLEYHFLLGGPFRLILFGDAGNVFGRQQTLDLSNLRYTTGLELRVLLPVFGAPLRFIYAKNLNPKPDDNFESFQFSIGTSF